MSPALQVDSLPAELPGKPMCVCVYVCVCVCVCVFDFLTLCWSIVYYGLPQWLVKNPPIMYEPQETRVQSLGQEESLEEEMATHSNALAWEIPWTEEPGSL